MWGGLIRIVTPKSETSSLVSKTAAAQLLKYLTVGVVSVGLETTLFWWLFRQLHIAWVVANSLAIFITLWFNFFLNRLWSFRSHGLLTRQLVLYVALFCFNLVMSNLGNPRRAVPTESVSPPVIVAPRSGPSITLTRREVTT